MIIPDKSRIEEATETREFLMVSITVPLHFLEIDPRTWAQESSNGKVHLKNGTMEPHKEWSHRMSISRDVERFDLKNWPSYKP